MRAVVSYRKGRRCARRAPEIVRYPEQVALTVRCRCVDERPVRHERLLDRPPYVVLPRQCRRRRRLAAKDDRAPGCHLIILRVERLARVRDIEVDTCPVRPLLHRRFQGSREPRPRVVHSTKYLHVVCSRRGNVHSDVAVRQRLPDVVGRRHGREEIHCDSRRAGRERDDGVRGREADTRLRGGLRIVHAVDLAEEVVRDAVDARKDGPVQRLALPELGLRRGQVRGYIAGEPGGEIWVAHGEWVGGDAGCAGVCSGREEESHCAAEQREERCEMHFWE